MEERRRADPAIKQLTDDVHLLKSQMATNTAVTLQVRDLLASFRLLSKLASWMGAIVLWLYSIKSGWWEWLRP